MEIKNPAFVDSHVHIEAIEQKNFERIPWLKSKNCLLVSWSMANQVDSIDELESYLQAQADTIEKLNEKGLSCYFLTGIHPRNITNDLETGDVGDLLAPHLKNPRCLGLGEIGLETARAREKAIFAQQLALGSMLKSKEMRIGIHTPRQNKLEITREIFGILKAYPGLEEIAVIDHCNSETAGWVLKSGYWAGITLNSVKASVSDLEKIVKRYPDMVNKIMCNTDSGSVFHEDLFRLTQDSLFSADTTRMLTRNNALDFFKLNPQRT